MKEFTLDYKLGKTINVIQAKKSKNKKIGIGYVIQTYHFSIEQIKENAIENDKRNCMDCPLSFNMNNGKSGGCYTHKGFQRLGLHSMINRLHEKFISGNIQEFSESTFFDFISFVKNYKQVDLVRFGAYGEPTLLPLSVVKTLSTMGAKTTGYTHQWSKVEYNEYKNYFMASTHTENERIEAKQLGFRSFFVAENKIKGFKLSKAVNCPASKESEKNLTCIACGLCNGAIRGNKKDVYINKH